MAPSDRLSFPAAPVSQEPANTWYDVDHDGQPDFVLRHDSERVYAIGYTAGADRREYDLDAYDAAEVPHVVILLDSIPYEVMAERYRQGHFRFFYPPLKMIAPFPSLTEICYSDILEAPPLPAVIDTQYDPRLRAHRSDLWKRVGGYRQPWERRLTYECSFAESGLTFLDPKKWYAAELARAKQAIDDSPRRTTIVYFASAASMVCRFGRAGAEEVLDGAEQLCLQLLYERHGAIKISMMADHGHNLVESKNVDLAALLTADRFHVVDRPKTPDDVTISINGLVTNALVQTGNPEPVARALVRHEPIELAMYVDDANVTVCGAGGRARIEHHRDQFRYVPVDGDPLNYRPLIRELQAAHLLDAEGWGDESQWLRGTADTAWPNAPARVWNAFHRQTVTPPTIMLSFKDGYYCGRPEYEKFITMKSTHGGLNQINSATFIATMEDHDQTPVLPRDVMPMLLGNKPVEIVR